MPRRSNPMDILKVLDKSNCRKCGEATCVAFAAAVARGLRTLDECPSVEEDIIAQFGGEPLDRRPSDRDVEEVVSRLKGRLRTLDLEAAAKRLKAPFKDGVLMLKICGKDFGVDSEGSFYSEIHIHSWVTLPVLNYIVEGEGVEPTGQWVSLRELKGGKDWGRFFEHRCEKPMKKLADSYTGFFADMLHIFGGRQVERQFDSDISLVLHPLPKVPILICYWKPEDGLESDFHLFFDSTAENNLTIESIYLLATGLLTMLEKIASRHH